MNNSGGRYWLNAEHIVRLLDQGFRMDPDGAGYRSSPEEVGVDLLLNVVTDDTDVALQAAHDAWDRALPDGPSLNARGCPCCGPPFHAFED